MTPSQPQQVLTPATAPAAPTPPPAFASSPTGTKPAKKSATPTFLGAGTIANAPAQSASPSTGKTLLGQ